MSKQEGNLSSPGMKAALRSFVRLMALAWKTDKGSIACSVGAAILTSAGTIAHIVAQALC